MKGKPCCILLRLKDLFKEYLLKPKHEKIVIAFVCFLGVYGIAYGMMRENHAIFLAGIGLVVGSYLFIRRKLKG